MSTTGGLTRDILETRVLGVLRWVVIVSLIVLTTFPFLYMALLSVRERAGALALLEEVTYVELSDRPDFNDAFVEQLAFSR